MKPFLSRLNSKQTVGVKGSSEIYLCPMGAFD